jgi:HSP20 family protein
MISLRYSPLYDFENELRQMRSQLSGVFGDRRNGHQPAATATGYPLLNAWGDEQCFYVEAELPGVALDDIDICMTDPETVAIKGCRKEPTLDHGQWRRRERGFGSFERSLRLPGAIDQDQVEATLKHGVLTIKLPKAPELRPRKIEVKAV